MHQKNKVFIVEDVSFIRMMLEECLRENGYEVVGSSPSAEKAWDSICSSAVDLVLTDINLVGEKNGIWLGHNINTQLTIPHIFITAYQVQYTSNEVMETNPAGFIIKPINTIQLITTVKIALNQNTDKIKNHILVQDGLKAINLCMDDICYIQSEGNYLHIFLEDSHVLVRSTFSSFFERLDNTKFVRIHMRYAINLTKKYQLDTDYVYMNGKALSISSSYKKELKKKLKM